MFFRGIFWINSVQMTSSRVVVRWSWMGAGTSALHFIDGSHTCLHYYRPLQHIAVPWVLHTHTITNTNRHTARGYSTSLDRGV